MNGKWWGLFLAGCLMVATPALGDGARPDEGLEVMGQSRISGSISAARNAAVTDALRQAVRQGVGSMLPVSSLQENLDKLGMVVAVPPRGFVKEYRVLATATEGKHYRVIVSVSPDYEKISEQLTALGISGVDVPLPRILFLVSEQQLSDGEPVKWWDLPMDVPTPLLSGERLLEEDFRKTGFSVVPHDGVLPMAAFDLGKKEARLSEAVRVGREYGAEVVITGAISTKPAANTMGESLRSFKGEATLSAVSVATGEELVALSEFSVDLGEDPGEGSRMAFANATASAATALSKRLKEEWRKRLLATKEDREIRIRIHGERFLTRFVQFRKILSGVEGVSRMQRREMSTTGMDVALRYTGTPEQLATEILKHSYKGYGVTLEVAGEDLLDLAFVTE